MKIKKYEHACLTVEASGRLLVIDPGEYSFDFTAGDNIDAVVITHEHSDHFDPSKVVAIRSLNPNVVIFTTAKVAGEIADAKVPNTGEKITVGNFTLEFFGHDHAPVIDNIVPCDNFGVIVDDRLVYPGDSFSACPLQNPEILALPVSAPWMKIGEAIDYLRTVKPVKVFPTHNALLSEIGQNMIDAWLGKICREIGTEYIPLKPGQSSQF